MVKFKVRPNRKMTTHAEFCSVRNFEGQVIAWHPVVVYIEINYNFSLAIHPLIPNASQVPW